MNRRVRRLVAVSGACCVIALTTSCAVTSAAGSVATVTRTVVTTVVPPPVTIVIKETETEQAITVTAQTPGPSASFRDGQHIVGRDIMPGTYRASSVSDICFWERKDQDGSVIDNAFSTVATIRSSDFTFQSNRCGTWSRVD